MGSESRVRGALPQQGRSGQPSGSLNPDLPVIDLQRYHRNSMVGYFRSYLVLVDPIYFAFNLFAF
jgi:hypothetical protein